MSNPQGNNTVNNQLTVNLDNVPNRRISDNFSSSRSYAPECKFYLLINSDSRRRRRKRLDLILDYICYIMNEKPEAFIMHQYISD